MERVGEHAVGFYTSTRNLNQLFIPNKEENLFHNNVMLYLQTTAREVRCLLEISPSKISAHARMGIAIGQWPET